MKNVKSLVIQNLLSGCTVTLVLDSEPVLLLFLLRRFVAVFSLLAHFNLAVIIKVGDVLFKSLECP